MDLEARLGYHFRDPGLLAQALTHRSARERADEGDAAEILNNERLEFLGDAVLGMVVAQRLFETFPHWDEGRLTRGRARFVCAKSLEKAAQCLDLAGALRVDPSLLGTRSVRRPVRNAVESLVGALFLDGGMGAVELFVTRWILQDLHGQLDADPWFDDPKSSLQELAQARGWHSPTYEVLEKSGPEHDCSFRVRVQVRGEFMGEGTGSSIKEAGQVAAATALGILQSGQREVRSCVVS